MTATIDTYFAACLLSYSGRLDRRNRPSNSPSLVQIFPLFFFGFSFSSSNQKHSRSDFTPKIHRHLFTLFLSNSSSSVKMNPPRPLDTAQTPNLQTHRHLLSLSQTQNLFSPQHEPHHHCRLHNNLTTTSKPSTQWPPSNPNPPRCHQLATPIHYCVDCTAL